MIKFRDAEVTLVVEKIVEFDYGWSLDDRLAHIHEMGRAGYSLQSVRSDTDGHHAVFKMSHTHQINKYQEGVMSEAPLNAKNVAEIYNTANVDFGIGTKIDVKA